MALERRAHLLTYFSKKKEDDLCLSSIYALKLRPRSMRDTTDSHESRKEYDAAVDVDDP